MEIPLKFQGNQTTDHITLHQHQFPEYFFKYSKSKSKQRLHLIIYTAMRLDLTNLEQATLLYLLIFVYQLHLLIMSLSNLNYCVSL
jgi:hypothetical protein